MPLQEESRYCWSSGGKGNTHISKRTLLGLSETLAALEQECSKEPRKLAYCFFFNLCVL